MLRLGALVAHIPALRVAGANRDNTKRCCSNGGHFRQKYYYGKEYRPDRDDHTFWPLEQFRLRRQKWLTLRPPPGSRLIRAVHQPLPRAVHLISSDLVRPWPP